MFWPIVCIWRGMMKDWQGLHLCNDLFSFAHERNPCSEGGLAEDAKNRGWGRAAAEQRHMWNTESSKPRFLSRKKAQGFHAEVFIDTEIRRYWNKLRR